MYTASRVSFYLPRKIGKRKETLLEACTIFDPLIIQKHGWVSPVSNQLYRFAPLYACLIIGFAVNVFAPTAYCLQPIDEQVLAKAVRCASLTEPLSRSLFNFLCSNDTFVSLPTGHGKALIYQICPAGANGKKVPIWTNGRCYLSSNFPYSWSNKFQCKMGLTGLPDSYSSWHLYLSRLLFGLSTFFVASLLFMKGREGGWCYLLAFYIVTPGPAEIRTVCKYGR